MTLEQASFLGQTIASVAVVVSLGFVAFQLRQSTLVAGAQSRLDLSVFAFEISKFRADNADRLARVHRGEALSEGDQLFRFWDHMMILLHAEIYYRHYELGLMPASHWNGYVRYIEGYLATPGFEDCWRQIGSGFSEDFAAWLDGRLSARKSSTPAPAQD